MVTVFSWPRRALSIKTGPSEGRRPWHGPAVLATRQGLQCRLFVDDVREHLGDIVATERTGDGHEVGGGPLRKRRVKPADLEFVDLGPVAPDLLVEEGGRVGGKKDVRRNPGRSRPRVAGSYSDGRASVHSSVT